MTTDKIYDSLAAFGQHIKLTRQLSVEDFLQRMEPVFTQCGCRQEFSPSAPRILVIHNGGVGDFVLFTPCLREIRRLYPTAHITLTVAPNATSLAETCPYIDTLISCSQLNTTQFTAELYFELVDFAKTNFSQHFDLAFNFGVFIAGVLLAYMSGAKERLLHIDRFGWELWQNIPYSFAQALSTVQSPQKHLSDHTVDRYLAVLDNLLHVPAANRELEIWFSAADTDGVRELLSFPAQAKIIALCMGGLGGVKSYPAEKYAALLELILKQDKDICVVILGGNAETAAATYVAQSLPAGRALNLAGRISYRQTAALLSLCDFYLGNDTGCTHLAAALKLPCLTVYSYAANLPANGHSSVEAYYPYRTAAVIMQPEKALSPCAPLHSAYGEVMGCTAMKPHCIAQVSVAEMYEGWLTLQKITSQPPAANS